jgi:hypothetical protein
LAIAPSIGDETMLEITSGVGVQLRFQVADAERIVNRADQIGVSVTSRRHYHPARLLQRGRAFEFDIQRHDPVSACLMIRGRVGKLYRYSRRGNRDVRILDLLCGCYVFGGAVQRTGNEAHEVSVGGVLAELS